MNENPNLAVVKALGDAYAKNDLEAALTLMTEDIIWEIPGPPGVPYAGIFHGKVGFRDFWALLGDSVDLERGGIDEMFAQSNTVVGLGSERGKTKETGRPYHYSWTQVYRFTDDHKIKSIRQYYSPLNIAAALGL